MLVRKKEKGKVVEEYRGVTLMPTIYKIYAMVIAERIRKKTEKKRVIPHIQTGFKRKCGQ